MRAGRYLFLLLLPLIPWLQAEIDRREAESRRSGWLYVESGEHVRKMWPGLEDLMADIYWLRTVQYNGRQRLAPGDPPFAHLYTLIDITTTLDTRLEIAYWYGSVFLAERFPLGKGAPQEGRAVLEKGVRNMPDSWRIRQHLGFFHYLYLHDRRAAAQILLDGAKLPGAPHWMQTLAARMLADSNERDSARAIWRHLYDAAEDDVMRENALYNLQRLDALDVLEAWNRLAQEGPRPRSFGELVPRARGRLPTADPAGVTFEYDAEKGQVVIARRSRLWRP